MRKFSENFRKKIPEISKMFHYVSGESRKFKKVQNVLEEKL
jgi:hypothetical protein